MSVRRSNVEPLKRFKDAKISIGEIYNELETYVTDLSLFYNGKYKILCTACKFTNYSTGVKNQLQIIR